jgi:NDP-sugar pyrophosphorylase family protein
MILAAGLGLRLRPLTGARPKPLLPVLNKPLLYYWLERLQGLGVRRAVINAYHLAPMIVEAARNLPPGLGDIEALVSVEGELLGTAGGLKKAAMLLFPPGPPRASGASEPFYVVNGDIHTDIDLALLAETHQALASQAPHGPPVTMALVDYPPKATVSLGQDGQIVAFRHNGPCPGETSRLCGAGLAVMERWFLETLPGHFSDTVEILKGRMALGDRPGSRFFPGAAWADIGSLPEYYSLNKGLARGRALLQSP